MGTRYLGLRLLLFQACQQGAESEKDQWEFEPVILEDDNVGSNSLTHCAIMLGPGLSVVQMKELNAEK